MILIVDGNAAAHRAKHTTGGMKWNGEYTGVIYGFFSQLHTMVLKYQPDQICFAWDSRSSLRKKIYPEYKAKRNKAKMKLTKEEKLFNDACFTQFYDLQEEILPSIGFINNFKIKGYEGDDLIASICKYNKGKKIVATSDNDMFQLLSDDVEIYDLRNKKHFNHNDFQKKYTIDSDQWVDVKAIAGCTSDEVEGITGVGEPTAIKYLKGDLKQSSLTYQKIIQGKDIIDRNFSLVRLPFEGTPEIKLKENKIDLSKMKSIFMDYGFRSFVSKDKFDTWKILKG